MKNLSGCDRLDLRRFGDSNAHSAWQTRSARPGELKVFDALGSQTRCNAPAV